MADTIKIRHEALKDARRKFLQLGREIQAGASTRDLQHTHSKLGIFLDEATDRAFRDCVAPSVFPLTAATPDKSGGSEQ